MKLKEKILEFQSYNQQNVDTAKAHIAQLNQTLEEKQEAIEERERREQQLEAKILNMEKKWTVRQALTQQDIFEAKARKFHEHQTMRRVFDRFMKNILVCACARRIRISIF